MGEGVSRWYFLLGCWGMWGEEGRKEGRGDGQMKNSGSILSYFVYLCHDHGTIEVADLPSHDPITRLQRYSYGPRIP